MLLLLFVGGCTSAADMSQEADMLPASALLNSLKCEIAAYAAENPSQPIVAKNWTIQGTLELNVTSEVKTGGRVDVLVPLAARPVGIGVDIGSAENRSRKATVEFVLALNPKQNSACTTHPSDTGRLSDGSVTVEEIGISNWLNTFQSVSSQGAIFDAKKYTYCVMFGVKRRAEVGVSGGFTLVPLSLKGQAAANRDDIQIISIAITEPSGGGRDTKRDGNVRAAGRSIVPSQSGSARAGSSEPVLRDDIRKILQNERRKLLAAT
jgi:hypothetical protein